MTLGTRIKHLTNSPNVSQPCAEMEGTVQAGTQGIESTNTARKQTSNPKRINNKRKETLPPVSCLLR